MSSRRNRSPENNDTRIDPRTGLLREIYDRPEVHAMAQQELALAHRQQTLSKRAGKMALKGVVAPLAAAHNMYNSLNEISVTDTAREKARNGAADILTAMPGILLMGAVKISGKLGLELAAKKAAAYQARQRAKAEAKRQTALSNAVDQYKSDNPHEVAALQEQKRSIAINKALEWPAAQQQSMIEYFALPARHQSVGRDAYSLSKFVPRRADGFEGSYQDLAAATLSTAQESSRHQPDGFVMLLGADERTQRAQEASANSGIAQLETNEMAYNGGVAAALWQLGFIESARGEEGIAHSQAQFNPSIEWSQTHHLAQTVDGYDQTYHRARLAFDGNNELHQMLVPEGLQGNPNLMLELEFSEGAQQRGVHGSVGGEYMGISVVPAQVPQMAGAH
jgi:hypothetical protein